MDLFDLFAKLSLDTSAYESGMSKVVSGAKSTFSTLGKVAVAGVGTATTAIGALSKVSLDAYSSYEQLTGGVETLFKSSSDALIDYADNAYKTAGMSANEYMDTVTSFSATLLQGLEGDTDSAVEVANQAITDMADNANKMGTSMESIQFAYQGFAKQNYTMLDNLKLGYGGTQAEMARLINDSGVLGDTMTVTAKTVNEVSFDKIIEAIHVVQTNLGITGTTAKEAATTIEGSVNSAKAAWTNLVTGIANENANLDTLIGNFVESATTAAGNVLPRLEQILEGMGTAIQKISPVLAEQIPALVSQVLPPMVSAGAQLVVGLSEGLVSAVPELVNSIPGIVQNVVASFEAAAPSLVAAGGSLLTMLGNGIMTGMPLLADSAVTVMANLGIYLQGNLPTLMQSGLQIISGFAQSLRDNAGTLVDGALSLAQSLAQGLADSIPIIVENVPEIVTNIAGVINDNAPKVLVAAGEIMLTLAKGLVEAIPTVVQNLPQIVNAIVDVFAAFNWLNLGKSIIEGLGNGVKAAASFVKDASGQIVTVIKDGISALPGEMVTIGNQIIQGLINGIKGMASAAKDSIVSVGLGIVTSIKNALGIHSPSTVFEDIGNYIMQGLDIGLKNGADKVMETVDDVADELKTRLSTIVNAFSTQQGIAGLEYELWQKTVGKTATEAEDLGEKLKALTAEQDNQNKTLEATQAAYDKIVSLYGEASTEAAEYKKKLLEEQIALAETQNEIEETTAALEKQTDATEQFKSALSVAMDKTDDFGSAIATLGNNASKAGDALGIDLLSGVGSVISKMGSGISSVIGFANSLIDVANSVSNVTSALSNLTSIAGTLSKGGGLMSALGSILGGTTGIGALGIIGSIGLGGYNLSVGTSKIKDLWSSDKSIIEKVLGTIYYGPGLGGIIDTVLGKNKSEKTDEVNSDLLGSIESMTSSIESSVKNYISSGTTSSAASGGGTVIEKVEIYIEGSQYKDEDSLAEAISIKLQNLTERKVSVFA